MTDQHPITPPPELAAEWVAEIYGNTVVIPLQQPTLDVIARAARRPKPPSLKKQALEALDEAIFMADDDPPEGICSDQADIIRRALEALTDD